MLRHTLQRAEVLAWSRCDAIRRSTDGGSVSRPAPCPLSSWSVLLIAAAFVQMFKTVKKKRWKKKREKKDKEKQLRFVPIIKCLMYNDTVYLYHKREENGQVIEEKNAVAH